MTDQRRVQAEREIQAVNDALIRGARANLSTSTNPGAIFEAAKELGVTPPSLRHRVGTPQLGGLWDRTYGLRPDWSLEKPVYPEPKDQFTEYVAIHNTARCRVRIVNRKSDAPVSRGPIVRVAFVTDSHDAPHIPKDRFRWIGEWVADTAPDHLVHGGDFASFDSLSQHDSWGSLTGREREPYLADMDSLQWALDEFLGPIERMPSKPRMHITFGNHEERAWRFENERPELRGQIWTPVEDAFASRDFASYGYKDWLFIEGVGFTHAPHNAAGRPYMGKFPERQMATDATFSMCYGHTHKAAYEHIAKLGPANRVSVFNPGCSLPHGYTESYARMSISGWSWGVGMLTIQDGSIIGHEIVPMTTLEDRYK